MKSKRKELEGKVGAVAFRWAQRFFSKKSAVRAEAIGAKLGRLFFRLSRKHRERATNNLKLVFPQLSETERLDLARRAFEHFGRTTADFLHGANRTKEELDATTEVIGEENLKAALAHGRGVLLITGHFGNWERMSAWMSFHGYTLSVIARDTNDTGLNGMVNRIREAPGTRVISRDDSIRTILERLKANELVGILPDQNAQQALIPFFGHPAGTVLGPGVLHERTKAPVICCWCVYVSPGRYKMTIEEPLILESTETRGEATMIAIHQALEEAIRQHPDQWLWFHDRWKYARQQGVL